MCQFLLKPLTLFLFLLTVSQFQRAFAQNSLYPVREWVGKLNSKNDKKNEAFKNLDSLLSLVDSAKIFSFLNELWDKGKSKGYYFHARFNCLKSRQLYLKNIPHNLSVVK